MRSEEEDRMVLLEGEAQDKKKRERKRIKLAPHTKNNTPISALIFGALCKIYLSGSKPAQQSMLHQRDCGEVAAGTGLCSAVGGG
jgi:hypothetical protein